MPNARFLSAGRIPLWLKLLYTAFMAVLVPYYWIQYTPVNFLWFCDVALFVTLAALWTESKLLASMQAVAVVLPDTLWIADFLVRAVGGVHIIDLTEYMFDPKNPLYVRGLSLFHVWLPFLLLYMVWRLGYDRRACIAQTALAWLVLWLSYLFVQDPTDNHGPGNVNKIGGPSDDQVQTWMDPRLWVVALMVVYPVCVYLPTHLLLWWVFRGRGNRAR